jgi:hypothetical protein
MKKSNLKSGMVLVTRNNESFLVLPYSGTSTNLYAFNIKNSSQVNLDIWDDNLLNKYSNSALDVVEVQAIKYFRELVSGEVTEVTSLWKRPSEAQLKLELENLLKQVQSVLGIL